MTDRSSFLHQFMPTDPDPDPDPDPDSDTVADVFGEAGLEAIVLLSGGLDSATCLAIAVDAGYDRITPVHFTYGQQTAAIEHDRAAALADYYDTRPLRVISYTDVFEAAGLAHGVAGERETFATAGETTENVEADGRSTGYVPMRNLQFLATAGGIADRRAADTIYIGAQAGDAAAYPDCRRPFLWAAEEAINTSLADDHQLVVSAPLLDDSKVEVLERAQALDVPFELTYSCYRATDPTDPVPCGDCPACIERRDAFAALDTDDPLQAGFHS